MRAKAYQQFNHSAIIHRETLRQIRSKRIKNLLEELASTDLGARRFGRAIVGSATYVAPGAKIVWVAISKMHSLAVLIFKESDRSLIFHATKIKAGSRKLSAHEIYKAQNQLYDLQIAQ